MAAETPQTWAERIVPFDEGDPITGREATVVGEDALNGFRALLLGLAQSHGLSADASHAQIMEAFKQGHALTGEIKTYAGPSAPTGWLLCNGVLVRLTDHPALFGVFAHAYALEADTADSTATTFRLPDLRGRTPIGAGDGTGLTARALGAKGGKEKHTLAVAEMPEHRHQSGSNVGLRAGNSYGDGLVSNLNFGARGYSGFTGDNASHSITQPFLAVNYIIKT